MLIEPFDEYLSFDSVAMAFDLYKEICASKDDLESVSQNSYQSFRYILRVCDFSGAYSCGSEWGSFCEWIHAVEDNLLTEQHRPWNFLFSSITGDTISRLLNLMENGMCFPSQNTFMADGSRKAPFSGMRKFILLSLDISQFLFIYKGHWPSCNPHFPPPVFGDAF